MYRDRGPHHNLGYGIPIWGTPETEDGLPNSGAASPIQRLLHERPTLAFFTTAASSLVGMYVAGRVASKGGIRFAAKAQQLAKQETRLGRSIAAGTQSFRRIQAELDALEGISRRFVDDAGRVIPAPEDAFVIKHGDRWLGRKTIKRDGWSYRWDNPNVDPWTLRDEIQQRLVHQARRLPYELPAFYVLDKALINPLLGEDQGKRQPNWGNPFDVIGDFAWESVKNTAGYVLPFEAGSAATKQGFRNLMRGIETGATSSPGLVSLKATLELVGADATDLVNKGLRLSHQSLGAFSMMVQDAQDNSKTLDQFWKSHGRSAVTSPRREIGNASAARRAWERSVFRFKNQDLGKHAIDTMPGPFKGMGTAISRFKGHFKDIGQTYDDWQNIISGRTSITQLDDIRAERVRDFMKRGGGTYLEQFSQDVWRLGHGGPTLPNGTVNTQWKHGQFYRQRSQHVYDGLLIRALADNTGLKEEHALQFIRMSNKISPYAGGRGSEPYSFDNLIERIQFSRNQPHAKSIDEWWASLTRGISEHGIPFDPNKLTLESFKRSVKQADLKYSNEAFRELMDADLASQWKHLHGQVLPQIAGKSLASGRLPYSDFANANLGQDATRQFLIRRTAQRLGIDIVDAAGNQLPIDNLKQMIRSHGLNPSDPHKLRGFLIDQKDINVPWARGGGNIFGIRALSVQEAIDNGYFSGQPAEVQREMSYLVNQKTFAAAVGRGGNLFNHASDARKQTRMKGVYTNARGNVIDLGRVRRGIMASMDTFASEYKIPILNVNPLQVGFWNKYQAMRNASPINMLSPHSLQPGPIMGANSDFNLLIKTSATGTKGSVYGITGGAISGTQSRQIPGVFRPSLVAGIGMDARNAQLFFGQGSSAPGSRSWDLAEPTTRRQQIANRLRSRFDVSVDQPGSLVVGENSFLRRWWRARKGSLHNPNRLAKALADPTLTLNGGKALHDSASRGIENLADALRHYGFDRSTLRELIKDDPTFDKLRRFIDLPDSELPNAIRELLDTDLRVTFNTDIARTQGARAQNQLRSMLTWGEKGVNRWGLPASSAGKTAGIGRRIDELRSELVQYFVGTADFRAGGEDFGRIASNFLTRVEDLYSSGAISRVERTEMRTAILGMQVERARSTAYGMMRNIDPSQQKPFTFYDFNMKSIEQIFQTGLDPATTRQLLSEFGSFEEGASFLSAPFRRMGRSFAATDAYETRWLVNPYGTDVLAEPTFQTAFGANPLKAVMGLTGTSWSPEAFSGAAVPATHMVTRLNKYFETFGLGLDPSRYRSPVDMFARGMVGKRIAPTFALGATAYSLDASLGGLLNERDAEGNPVYSPYILGKGATLAAHGQIGLAGLVPGGQTVEEKREELFGSAQVPVRQGRWWLFGNQPWEGGRIQYFRPSWYQRFKAGGAFTPEMNETPMERLAFGYDFSPLRPLDPYRFERQNAASRPYPVSGDYFTGPYGPITPLLNQTVGRILKPRRQLVSDEALQFYAQQYQRVGDQGAYMSPTPALAAGPMSAINTGYMNAGIGTGSANVLYPAMGYAPPRGRASQEVRGRTEALGQMYSQAAANPGSYVGVYQSLSPYGVPIARGSGISPRIISSEPMVDYGSVGNQMRRFGYTTQEMAGIYGFAFGSLRQGMGWGGQDFNQTAAMLQPASQGYSSARAFWNLNIGGLGDIPLGVSSGGIGNLEISEIIRRFVPREPTNDYVNPLPNLLGQQHPWLPGANYPINPIKMGDPYNIPDAVYRLPGTGFSRTNLTFGSPDNLGIANVHQILGDIAPWSEEYRAANNLVNRADLSPLEQALVNRTRAQVEAKRFENEFTPYVYRYQSSGEMMKHPISYGVGRLGEWLTHRDTFYNSKFMRTRTAVEDWERDNVYGATYPSWSSPISSFVEPALSRSTQRNPVAAALTLGFAGRFFGRTRQAQLTGTIVGGATGLAGSLYGTAYESITGNRFIPKERRQQIALEEYVDMLSYVRAGVNAARSAQMGDMQAAQDFMFQASRTMYGANLNSTPEELAMSIPDRKREHFRAMLFAPEEEREQILSTAGRLERRLFQAAWGMPVEELPDLREYFEEHELPGLDSGFWDPNVDMDNIKIKIGQSLGMDMAQMGFYPQQIREANLINPIYPEMMRDSGRIPGDMSTILMQLQIMAARQGGSVQRIPIPYGGDRFELNAGTW